MKEAACLVAACAREKYLLQDGRKTMTHIFDNRCALVNKNGVCHQCSELNGWFTPKQNQQETLMKNRPCKRLKEIQQTRTLFYAYKSCKTIDPLRSNGADLFCNVSCEMN